VDARPPGRGAEVPDRAVVHAVIRARGACIRARMTVWRAAVLTAKSRTLRERSEATRTAWASPPLPAVLPSDRVGGLESGPTLED
jgi:hypothetical protein